MDNHVLYICVDGGRGRAIVAGERAYEVEFDFAGGEIRNLICSCPCGYTCKHEVAAMMQLKETLDLIEKIMMICTTVTSLPLLRGICSDSPSIVARPEVSHCKVGGKCV